MYSIVVVPPPTTEDERGDTRFRLAPGERLTFGRSASDNDLEIPHAGASRATGEIKTTAQGAFWILSNHSTSQTYVVENPEGAGEHIKVGPGRLDAPIPFEFSRIVLPAAGGRRPAPDRGVGTAPRPPRHDHRDPSAGPTGATTAPTFSVDRTKRYFAVLA